MHSNDYFIFINGHITWRGYKYRVNNTDGHKNFSYFSGLVTKAKKCYTVVTIVFSLQQGHFNPKTQQTGHKVSRKHATSILMETFLADTTINESSNPTWLTDLTTHLCPAYLVYRVFWAKWPSWSKKMTIFNPNMAIQEGDELDFLLNIKPFWKRFAIC